MRFTGGTTGALPAFWHRLERSTLPDRLCGSVARSSTEIAISPRQRAADKASQRDGGARCLRRELQASFRHTQTAQREQPDGRPEVWRQRTSKHQWETGRARSGGAVRRKVLQESGSGGRTRTYDTRIMIPLL